MAALDSLMSCFGEDFGRNGDLTVIWPLQIEPSLTRRTPFVVELRNVPFRQQEQILFYVVDRLPHFLPARWTRAATASTWPRLLQRYGPRIGQVMLSPDWYRDNMPRYKAAFEDGTIEIPRMRDPFGSSRADDGQGHRQGARAP